MFEFNVRANCLRVQKFFALPRMYFSDSFMSWNKKILFPYTAITDCFL